MNSLSHISLVGWLLLLAIPYAQGQESLFTPFGKDDGMVSNKVFDIEDDANGNLWFATANGVAKLEGFEFKNYGIENDFGEEELVGFTTSPEGELWCYSSEGKAYCLKNGSFKGIALNNQLAQQVSARIINSMVVDKGRNVWISTVIGGGLWRVDSRSKTVENVAHLLTAKNGYFIREIEPGYYVYGSSPTVDGDDEVVLMAEMAGKKMEIPLSGKTSFGKSCFLKLEGSGFLFATGTEMVHFNANGVLARLFVEKNIESLLEDSEGKIWIGMQQGGVLCFPTGDISSMNRIEYLGRKSITSIKEDRSRNLWFGTANNGVFHFNLNPQIVYSQPVLSQGGDTTTIRSSQAVRLDNPSASLALGANLRDTFPPQVFFSSVRINNIDTLVQGEYQLQADQNFLEISFVGSSPGNPSGLFQYRYRMEGVDKKWIYTSSNRVQYTMLPPGLYNLQVEAMNKDGIWGREPAELGFVIHPFYYQTFWFKALMVLLVILVIGTGIIIYVQNLRSRVKQRSQIDKKIADLELKALRAQMNPHFIFNTLSSIQHYVSANNTEEALRYLSKFAKLMRVILDNSKRKEIPIKDELKAITLYLDLEKLRFKEKFDYSIIVDEALDTHYDLIPSMLIQPYLENSILHGIMHKEGKGHIDVGLVRQNGHIICVVEDDGIGRKKAGDIQKNRNKNYKSAGMSITRDRLEIINQVNESNLSVEVEDRENESVSATGTRVKIFIPFKNN
ncbi:histidine kinase [bacterium SCSIO 12741]|nr:histidine kinase [bacterium SCSIO 12741]